MKLYFYILDSNREYNPETKTLGDYILIVPMRAVLRP